MNITKKTNYLKTFLWGLKNSTFLCTCIVFFILLYASFGVYFIGKLLFSSDVFSNYAWGLLVNVMLIASFYISYYLELGIQCVAKYIKVCRNVSYLPYTSEEFDMVSENINFDEFMISFVNSISYTIKAFSTTYRIYYDRTSPQILQMKQLIKEKYHKSISEVQNYFYDFI